MQVPVARQRCENCPHQFISNAAPDREARKAARKEKKRLRAHRDGIQAAAKRLRAAANERAANAQETVNFAPDLATHGSSHLMPKFGVALMQLLAAPGLLAQGVEHANKPVTVLPFVGDENYEIQLEFAPS